MLRPHSSGVLPLILMLAVTVTSAQAQLAPEIGYVHPAGARAGSSIEVTLGGYDWTPDMQLFVHDPRVKLELLGTYSGVLVPEPPYWFGAKGRGPAWPIPREFKARLTIPADISPGLIRWQVANANGASPAGTIHVSSLPDVLEDSSRKAAQLLPELPVAVSGQIRRIEEIDEYEIRPAKSGPVTIALLARTLDSPLHGILKVRNAEGRVLLDAADTEGRDLSVTFAAEAGQAYTISLHDLDFAGDRSYVYRLLITPGPQVQAAYPLAGRRGETRSVEFTGIGLATGAVRLESITREITFPADAGVESHPVIVETPFGPAGDLTLLLSDLPELTEPSGASEMTLNELPCAVTGALETRFGTDQYTVTARKGDQWRIAARSGSESVPLDLEVRILTMDGREVVMNDDAAGTTNPVALLTVPEDGSYRILISDRSGHSGTRTAAYRLSIEPQREDVVVTAPEQLAVAIGAPAKLNVKAAREGGFKGPVSITLAGLPEGVTAPAEMVIPEGKSDLAIDLTCAADAPAGAALSTLSMTATLQGQPVTRRIGTVLIAAIMKPRIKLTPEGLDDVRKVNRGTTFFAPILIERLEGFDGEIVLEMTAKQQRHRQGLSSDEFTITPGLTRVEYPIFVPEWMETTKTSRMIVNGVVRVADPRGNVRHLVQKQEMRIGILPEGALLKLSHTAGEPVASPGSTVRIPVALSRAPEFRETVRIELLPPEGLADLMTSAPLSLSGDQSTSEIALQLAADPRLIGEQTLRIRASAVRGDRGQVISETTLLLTVRAR